MQKLFLMVLKRSGMDILELVYQANWPYEFKKETLEEAEHIVAVTRKKNFLMN